MTDVVSPSANGAPPVPPVAEPDRLQAAGRPITLWSGRKVRLRYSMRSMARIEKEFGSLKVLEDIGEKVQATEEGDLPDEPVLELLLRVMAAGLLHEGLGDPDLLGDDLNPARMFEYVTAMMEAIAEAMPEPGSLPPELAAQAAATGPSTGTSSTTSAPSPSGAPTSSSGG